MLITSSDQLRDVVARLAQYPAIAFDLETTGLYPAEGDKLCMASMYYPTEGAFSVAWRMHGAVPNLPEKTIKLLQPLLDTELVGHNIGPFDLNFLRREGLDLSGARVWDTLNGALLFNDSLGGYKLSVLCTSLLNDDGMERSGASLDPAWRLTRQPSADKEDREHHHIELEYASKEGPESLDPIALIYGKDTDKFELKVEEASLDRKILYQLGQAEEPISQAELTRRVGSSHDNVIARLVSDLEKKGQVVTKKMGQAKMVMLPGSKGDTGGLF